MRTVAQWLVCGLLMQALVSVCGQDGKAKLAVPKAKVPPVPIGMKPTLPDTNRLGDVAALALFAKPGLVDQNNYINNAATKLADASKILTSYYGDKLTSRAGAYADLAVALGSAARSEIATTQKGIEAANMYAANYINDKLAQLDKYAQVLADASKKLEMLIKSRYAPAAAATAGVAIQKLGTLGQTTKQVGQLAATVGSEALKTYGSMGQAVYANLAGIKALVGSLDDKATAALRKGAADYIMQFTGKVGGLASMLSKLNEKLGGSASTFKLLSSGLGSNSLQQLKGGLEVVAKYLGGDSSSSKMSNALDGALSLFGLGGLGGGAGLLKVPVKEALGQLGPGISGPLGKAGN